MDNNNNLDNNNTNDDILKDSIISSSNTDNNNNNNNDNITSLSSDVDIKATLSKILIFLTKEENRVKRRNERELKINQREQELKGKISPKKNSNYTDLVNDINDSKHKQWYLKAFDNPWTIPTIKIITSSIKLENGTVIYKVLVKEINGEEWYIYRRYSDFLSVQQYLDSIESTVPAPVTAHKLPPKDWNLRNRVIFPLDEKRLEERRLGLEAWLQDLLCFANEELSVHRVHKTYQAKLRIELAAFLDPPDNEGDEASSMKNIASLDEDIGVDSHILEEEEEDLILAPAVDPNTEVVEVETKTVETEAVEVETKDDASMITTSIENEVIPPPPAAISSISDTISSTATPAEGDFLYEYTRKKREKSTKVSADNDDDSTPIDVTLSTSNDDNLPALTKDIYQKFVNEVKELNVKNQPSDEASVSPPEPDNIEE